MVRTTRTVSGSRPSAIELGLLGAVGSLTALLASLTLAPEPANSSPAAHAVVTTIQVAPQTDPGATGPGETRRAVRVVYPGPITR
ncbi:hypothetical protein [Methylobacterium nonmethylotrophicum]|uniref:Uncharacterized protein n=1 Tax=Methylobacterium nonmethylotrophicum TaxID=1141884 RepID=A0A4Z0NWQ9_9HYPH|nr:hypothetical protein [Methylobacterium nonmethylotrophicum]TGE01009.1 hypothetical protein EU555_05215 [Methylobacterium nonmethylotrophicum]